MKRLHKEDYRIIYPYYLDSKRSRAEGRRVNKQYARPLPSQQELTTALNELGIRYEVQEDVAFPREHTKKSFRVIVFSSEKKSNLLKNIALRLKGA